MIEKRERKAPLEAAGVADGVLGGRGVIADPKDVLGMLFEEPDLWLGWLTMVSVEGLCLAAFNT